MFLIPIKSNAQFEFQNDAGDRPQSRIPNPNYDSIQFEFRMWEDGWFYPSFYQMTYDYNGAWSYKRGFICDQEMIQLDPVEPTPNIDSIWSILISKNVLTLKSQNEIRVSLKMDANIYKLNEEEFDKLLGTDGIGYMIELMTKDRYRSYYYINPISLSDRFNKSSQNHWIATEHHQMADIVNTLNEVFNRSEINALLVQKWKDNYNKNSKRPK